MCEKCMAKDITKAVMGGIFGVTFEDKLIGTASPEAIANVRAPRQALAQLQKIIDRDIAEAKEAIKEKYKGAYERLEQDRQNAWKDMFESMGAELDPDGDYSINNKTGEITLTVMVEPEGEQAVRH